MISYLFWELAVSLLCLVALAGVRPVAWKLALLIAANITVSALAATALSFLGWNQPASYIAIAAAFGQIV